MGLFDGLTGAKAPAPGVAPVSVEQLKAALLAVNRDAAPFRIGLDASAKADLVSEWRIVDARWYEIFAKAGLNKVQRVLMRFDDAAKEVRSVDDSWSIEWRAGVPTLSFAASVFRGQEASIEFGKAYGFTENVAVGEIYNYRFSSKELKSPLQEVVAANGWRWKAVAFGKR